MALSESGEKLRIIINRVIDSEKITHEEHDHIMALVNEDGHIDSQERALLSELQEMIQNKTIKFSKQV